ncbi:MAG TPA: peptidase M64 N-terminal domain-containing protein, partial [Blastocatellia bacterium]|nr:peptidase M64 N-terminal domain-containing protein [Blastocatellia bacterium]
MLKTLLLAVSLSVVLSVLANSVRAAAPTMRVDYYHTGNASQEMFSVDRVVIEPLPWPGNPQKNIDETNLGKYLFEVRDRTTNRLLYSRG